MSNSENVKRWRRKTKERMVAAMGQSCQVCGYDKCLDALAFHHLNPNEKDFSFSSVRANPSSWGKIANELKKCILVCHNCHSEIHAGQTSIPDIFKSFDDTYLDYKSREMEKKLDPCPVCGTPKHNIRKYCGKSCAAKMKGKVKWDDLDLFVLYRKHGSITAIAKSLDVSDQAVQKRMKVLGITLSDLKN